MISHQKFLESKLKQLKRHLENEKNIKKKLENEKKIVKKFYDEVKNLEDKDSDCEIEEVTNKLIRVNSSTDKTLSESRRHRLKQSLERQRLNNRVTEMKKELESTSYQLLLSNNANDNHLKELSEKNFLIEKLEDQLKELNINQKDLLEEVKELRMNRDDENKDSSFFKLEFERVSENLVSKISEVHYLQESNNKMRISLNKTLDELEEWKKKTLYFQRLLEENNLENWPEKHRQAQEKLKIMEMKCDDNERIKEQLSIVTLQLEKTSQELDFHSENFTKKYEKFSETSKKELLITQQQLEKSLLEEKELNSELQKRKIEISEYQNIIGEFKKENTELKEAITELNKILRDAEARLFENDSIKKEREIDNVKLEGTILELKNILDMEKEKYHLLEVEFLESNNRNSKIIDEKQIKLESLIKNNKNLVEELNNALSLEKWERSEIKKEKLKLEELSKQLEFTLDKTISEKNELELTLKKLSNQYDRVQSELAEKAQQICDAKITTENNDLYVKNFKKNFEVMKQEVQMEQEEKKILENKLKRFEEIVKDFKLQNESLRTVNKTIETNYNNLKSDLRNQSHELIQNEHMCNMVSEETEKLKKILEVEKEKSYEKDLLIQTQREQIKNLAIENEENKNDTLISKLKETIKELEYKLKAEKHLYDKNIKIKEKIITELKTQTNKKNKESHNGIHFLGNDLALEGDFKVSPICEESKRNKFNITRSLVKSISKF